LSWRSDLICSMTADEARTVLAAISGGQPEAFDWALRGMGGSLAGRFEACVPDDENRGPA
jgi:hypothetical protein